MCGIFGIVPTRKLKPQQIERCNILFNTLTYHSEIRGRDATGASIIQSGGDAWMYKMAVPARTILRDQTWRHMLTKAAPSTAMWMGHTRLATCGPNTNPNAHPFYFDNAEHGRLIGSHNGWIINYDNLGGDKTAVHEVDSACLFAWLAQAPLKEWPERLSKVWGAFALAMYRNGQIHLVRNWGSPLHFTYVPVISSYVYASTPEILQRSLEMVRSEYKTIAELPSDKIYSLTEGRSNVEIQEVPTTSVDNDYEYYYLTRH